VDAGAVISRSVDARVSARPLPADALRAEENFLGGYATKRHKKRKRINSIFCAFLWLAVT
jgi:hypothetical protein